MIQPIVRDVMFLSCKSQMATAEDLPVARDLADTLRAHAHECVGMAANMIGVRKRIIAVMAGKTVLVLYSDVSQLSGDSAGRLKVRTTGSGGGLLVRDGLAWPITWEREGESDRLSFYREDGQPAALGVGHSYINIVKTGTEVTWAAKSPEEAG